MFLREQNVFAFLEIVVSRWSNRFRHTIATSYTKVVIWEENRTRELDSQTTHVFGKKKEHFVILLLLSTLVLLYLLLLFCVLGMGIPLDCYGHFASDETKRNVVRYPIPWSRDLLYQHLWVVEDILELARIEERECGVA